MCAWVCVCVRVHARTHISCPPCSPFMSPNTRGSWQWPRVVHYVRTGSCRGCEETPWWYQNIYHRGTNTHKNVPTNTIQCCKLYSEDVGVFFLIIHTDIFFFAGSSIPSFLLFSKTKMKKMSWTGHVANLRFISRDRISQLIQNWFLIQ